jgi:hypothetical protein
VASLIYTVALNGYDAAYRNCINSQRKYAARLGVDFVSVVRPKLVSDPAFSAWLKVPIMLDALKSGYSEVAYIDADCMVRKTAPDFRTLVREAPASTLMANGMSGRLNSGVMLARSDASSISFFEKVMDSLAIAIPAEDRANLKFENGNIIYSARGDASVGVMDQAWNNTFDPTLDDHIRHFTGPLRAEYRRSLSAKIEYYIARKRTTPPTRQPESRPAEFVTALDSLTKTVFRTYPRLAARRG